MSRHESLGLEQVVVVASALAIAGAVAFCRTASAGADTPATVAVESVAYAAMMGHVPELKAALKLDPGGAKAVNPKDHGRTPLHLARDPAVVPILLAAGADVNALDSLGFTPLSLAVDDTDDHHSMRMVNALLDAGAAADRVEHAGSWTPLMRAAYDAVGTLEIAAALLAHRANVNVKGSLGETPLSLAAHGRSADHVRMAQLLVEHGADVNAVYREDFTNVQLTPLDGALRAKQSNPEMIEFLRAQGGKELASVKPVETKPKRTAAEQAEMQALIHESVNKRLGVTDADLELAPRAVQLVDAAKRAAVAMGYREAGGGRKGRQDDRTYESGATSIDVKVISFGNKSVRFTGIVSSRDGDTRAREARKFRAVFFKLAGIESVEKAGFEMDGNFVEY